LDRCDLEIYGFEVAMLKKMQNGGRNTSMMIPCEDMCLVVLSDIAAIAHLIEQSE
jgi:hypothetical protein